MRRLLQYLYALICLTLALAFSSCKVTCNYNAHPIRVAEADPAGHPKLITLLSGNRHPDWQPRSYYKNQPHTTRWSRGRIIYPKEN